jgi:hypothetical protein
VVSDLVSSLLSLQGTILPSSPYRTNNRIGSSQAPGIEVARYSTTNYTSLRPYYRAVWDLTGVWSHKSSCPIFPLLTFLRHPLSSLSFITVFYHCLLSLSFITVFYHCLLSLSFITVFYHCLLSQSLLHIPSRVTNSHYCANMNSQISHVSSLLYSSCFY